MTQIGIALLTEGGGTYPNDVRVQLPAAAREVSEHLVPREYVVSTSIRDGWRAASRLRARLLADNMGVIHAVSPGVASIAARWLSVRMELPLIASYYGTTGTTPRFGRWLYEDWLFGKGATIVVHSASAGAEVVRAGWSGQDRLVVAQPGVDPIRFSPGKRSTALRESWRVSDRRPAIICTGPLSRCELDLLSRIRAILDEYRRPHRFIVVGQSAHLLGWERALPDAALVGERDDASLGIALASGDIFLSVGQAAYPDPGSTLLMAQASGLPVIAANSGGRPEAMVEGLTGHLCRPGSEQDFVWRTAELLANTCRRAAMAASAATYARSRTWAAALAPIIKAYGDVSLQRTRVNGGVTAVGVRVRAS